LVKSTLREVDLGSHATYTAPPLHFHCRAARGAGGGLQGKGLWARGKRGQVGLHACTSSGHVPQVLCTHSGHVPPT
jgi:hypothetical protein